MGWFRSHPYAIGLTIAGILVITGMFIVLNRSSIVPASGTSAWSGGPGDVSNPAAIPVINTPTPITSSQPNTNASTSSTSTLPYTAPPPNNPNGNPDSGTFDFNTMVALLSQSSAKNTSSLNATTSGFNAYDFIPTGMISVSSPMQKKYDTSQQAIYDYSNEAGTLIQSYESRDSDQVQILKNSLADRADTDKSNAVAQIGKDLQYLGQQLAAIPQIPPEVAPDNTALAQSYQDVGQKLIDVSAANTLRDADFIAALQAYDTSADIFTKKYVALSLLVSAHGVSFAPDDPGSVFSFSPGPSF